MTNTNNCITIKWLPTYGGLNDYNTSKQQVEVLLTKEEIVMLINAYDSKAHKFNKILIELQTDLKVEPTGSDEMREKDLGICQRSVGKSE